MSGFGNVPPRPGKFPVPRASDLFEMWQIDANPKTGRPIGPVIARAIAWIPIISKKEKKRVDIPRMVHGFNPLTMKLEGGSRYLDMSPLVRMDISFYVNVIDDVLNQQEPARIPRWTEAEAKRADLFNWRNVHFKDKSSASWTPCRVWTPSQGAMEKCSVLGKQNFAEDEKGEKTAYDINDRRNGIQIVVSFDKGPPKRYPVAEGNPMYISSQDLEERYLLWDLAKLFPKPEEDRLVKADVEELKKQLDPEGSKNANRDNDRPGGESERSERDSRERDSRRQSEGDEEFSGRRSERDRDDRREESRSRDHDRDRERDRDDGHRSSRREDDERRDRDRDRDHDRDRDRDRDRSYERDDRRSSEDRSSRYRD